MGQAEDLLQRNVKHGLLDLLVEGFSTHMDAYTVKAGVVGQPVFPTAQN